MLYRPLLLNTPPPLVSFQAFHRARVQQEAEAEAASAEPGGAAAAPASEAADSASTSVAAPPVEGADAEDPSLAAAANLMTSAELDVGVLLPRDDDKVRAEPGPYICMCLCVYVCLCVFTHVCVYVFVSASG